jgi:hypothetical protein
MNELQMQELGLVYDCKHLEIEVTDQNRMLLEQASEEHYVSGSLPALVYKCKKKGIPCPYMNESLVKAVRREPTSELFAIMNNHDRFLDCEDREDTEYARSDHTVSRIRFFMNRVQSKLRKEF